MGFEVTTETATVYKLRFRKKDDEQQRFGWADAAVRSWQGGGSISIQSDFGTYAYTWRATGDQPFLSFLIGLDFDYFMGKTCPGYRQFDHEKTVDAVKRMIVERRRETPDHFSKEEARACWDDLDIFGGDYSDSADYFLSQILRSDALSNFFDGDYCDVIRTEPSPQSKGFWKELWPHMEAAWRSELDVSAQSGGV